MSDGATVELPSVWGKDKVGAELEARPERARRGAPAATHISAARTGTHSCVAPTSPCSAYHGVPLRSKMM
jgi:hypothetical protein